MNANGYEPLRPGIVAYYSCSISAEYRYIVQECDARNDAIYSIAGFIKKFSERITNCNVENKIIAAPVAVSKINLIKYPS